MRVRFPSKAVEMDFPVPAYSIQEPHSTVKPVLFTSPHSGSVYPERLLQQISVPVINMRRTEDAFVDELFASVPNRGGTLLQANYGRCFIDVNRDARELDKSMFKDGVPRTSGMPTSRVKAGLGCLPRIGAHGRELYTRKLARADGAARLDRIHDTYHMEIREILSQFRSEWSDCVLIDCHSMPSAQHGRRQLPDIVLGDRFGSSCDGRLTSAVERACRSQGLSVARNAPYAGGYTTRYYGRPRSGVHVLQIEINRSLYMNELTVEKDQGFVSTRSKIEHLCEAIFEFCDCENG